MIAPPLPFKPEELVIVEIVDGLADTSIVHLPARQAGRPGLRFDSFDFPPSTWPSACNRVKSGSVYVRAGEFSESIICEDCEATL